MDSKVQELLQEIENIKKTKGRIDIVEIANSLGIKVYATNEIEQSSLIAYDSETNCYEIIFNENQPKTRQRFSIAHEIAHFLLHKDKIITFGIVGRECAVSLSLQEEKEADNLAGMLLMPENCIKKALEQRKLTVENVIDTEIVKSIATEFSVSLIACALRLRELGYYVGYIEV